MTRILIIGASSGIGAAVVEALARRHPALPSYAGQAQDTKAQRDLFLILHGRDEERLEGVRAKVEGHKTKVDILTGDVVAWAEDLKSIPPIEPVDAIVWSAGICELAAGQMIGLKALRRTLAVNLEAPLVVLSHFYRKGIIKDGGVIVLLGSEAAQDAGEGFSVYAASKGGLASAARVLGKEFQRRGIRLVCLEPGTVNTPMTQRLAALFSPTAVAGRKSPVAGEEEREPRLGDTDYPMVEPEAVAAQVVGIINSHRHPRL